MQLPFAKAGIGRLGWDLVPREHSKGARAVLPFKEKQSPGLRHWPAQLTAPAHDKVAAVALANNLTRMSWTVLTTGNGIVLRYSPLPPSENLPMMRSKRWLEKRLATPHADSPVRRKSLIVPARSAGEPGEDATVDPARPALVNPILCGCLFP